MMILKSNLLKNLEVNAQTLFDAVYPRLTNMTFLDATPDQKRRLIERT